MQSVSSSGSSERNLFTTPWSLVLAAGSLDGEEGRKALGELVMLYKPALTSYLRKKFCAGSQEKAEELFCSFVERILVEKALVGKARPERGHQFRKFILTALHRFAISELRRLQAQKRKPELALESLDQLLEHDGAELGTVMPAEFDIAWARNVVGEALRRMKHACSASGQTRVWYVFEHRLLKPILAGTKPTPYAELVQHCAFQTPAQAHQALVRAKRMFEQYLREVISEYVADWSSVDTELRELHVILAHSKEPAG